MVPSSFNLRLIALLFVDKRAQTNLATSAMDKNKCYFSKVWKFQDFSVIQILREIHFDAPTQEIVMF